MPAQFLGKTPGRLNVFDLDAQVSDLDDLMKLKRKSPGMKPVKVFNTIKAKEFLRQNPTGVAPPQADDLTTSGRLGVPGGFSAAASNRNSRRSHHNNNNRNNNDSIISARRNHNNSSVGGQQQ